jgi:hypothetical protein
MRECARRSAALPRFPHATNSFLLCARVLTVLRHLALPFARPRRYIFPEAVAARERRRIEKLDEGKLRAELAARGVPALPAGATREALLAARLAAVGRSKSGGKGADAGAKVAAIAPAPAALKGGKNA